MWKTYPNRTGLPKVAYSRVVLQSMHACRCHQQQRSPRRKRSKMNPGHVERSVPRLYRDCLRLVDHIASKSPKGQQLRMILRTEFKKNKGVTDPEKIRELKGGAIRGLSNYLVHESGSNDPRLKERMDAVKSHALEDLKHHPQRESPSSR